MRSRRSTVELLGTLERSRRRHAPRDRIAKRGAIHALGKRVILDAALLVRFHEALCFLRAYPDDREVLGLVEQALDEFGARVALLRSTGPAAQAATLEETGIVGTVAYCLPSHPIAAWLSQRFPRQVEVDWDDVATVEGLRTLLALVIPLFREEALVEVVGVPCRSWLAAAKVDDSQSGLAWVLGGLERAVRDEAARQVLYDSLQLRIRWELQDARSSRTLARVPVDRVFFHTRPLLRSRGPLRRHSRGPGVGVRRAEPAEAVALLDLARASLTARYRETYAFNFANAEDVQVADAGRGVQIAWFGVLPSHRLPLRAHYGFLLLKNGVPVGYGDAALLFDWIDSGGGLNIFETYRHGESGYIFTRLAMFLYQHLGVRAIHLSGWDIGYQNQEALDSGAFWFYYNLGFRPKRTDLRLLAAAEKRRIARAPGYRSSRRMLARLSEAGMFASLDGRMDPAVRRFEPRRVIQQATALAARWSVRRLTTTVAGRLGVSRSRSWSPAERRTLERWAAVLALIPDLAGWSARERHRLVEAIREKSGPSEARYLDRLQGLPRLRAHILRLGGPPAAGADAVSDAPR